MPSVPNPRPFSDIYKLLQQVFVQKSGVNDIATGSSITAFLEAAAISDFRSQGDIIAALNSTDINRAEGSDLDNLGAAAGVLRPQSQASNGFVTIGSNNFTTIATVVYAGSAAPPMGSLTINISDGSMFPPTGAVYIGRGSNNVEGPLAYSSIAQVGTFYQLTLVSPTTKNHNINETVVLSQGGNRPVNVGTIVQTATNLTSPPVTFRVLTAVTIPDGQQSVIGIPVVCTQLGSAGNVSAGAINSFANAPFAGATVTNPVAYINGQDVASDQAYRLLIQNAPQTASKGTPLSIISAAVGVQSTDDNQTVTSAQLLQPSVRGNPAILYVDNGLAYQPIFTGQGFEQVITNANGGEEFLQLQNEDVTPALLVSSFAAPFVLTGGMQLAVEVGGVLSVHTFQDSDFATQNVAATSEVVNSINADTNLLFSAIAVNNSQNVELFAKAFVNEDLKVTTPASPLTVDANGALGFDTNLTYTLRLYKNDVLLIKDGQIPELLSLDQSSWSAMSSGETLTLQVDQSVFITYTFVDADFLPFNYAALLNSNALAAWAGVFNNKIAGINATVNGNQLEIQSNLGANNLAQLNILSGPSALPTGATLIGSGNSSLASKMFGLNTGIQSSTGRASDYALNRATGQIQLAEVLQAGDNVTAGSKNTRGFIDSASISVGSTTLNPATGTTAGPELWVSIDESAVLIPNAATTATQITVTNPSTNVWQFTSSVGTAFSDVLPGDWVILSDDAIYTLNHNFTSAFRVSAVSANSFQIRMSQSLGSTGGPFPLLNTGMSFIRTTGDIQELTLPSGLQTLTAIANSINTQFLGGEASAIGGQVLRLATNTFALTGSIIVAGFTSAIASLGFVVGSTDTSTVTHTAFAQSQTGELTIPAFIYDTVATGNANVPPTSFVSTTNLPSSLRVNPDELIAFLNPYGNISSNAGIHTQIASLSGTTVNIRANLLMRDIIASDRYFVAVPYDFDALDNLVVIFDNDEINKSLNIPLGRNGTVNAMQAPTTTQFTAYDTDAGPTANYPNQFGNNFSFQDFKIHFNAHQVLTPAGSNNQMLISSVTLGPTGNQVRVGIDYPTGPNAALNSQVSDGVYTDIIIYLSSGPQRLGGAWDPTTQFDITNPSTNVWQYTWNGIGTSPNFTGAGVAAGDVVYISGNESFAPDNTGTFQVVSVTSTYFQVTNFFGVAQNNVQLTAASNLQFWPLVPANNTATKIQAYAATALPGYITISQLQSGAGSVTTSTFDDNMGSSQYVQLADGENWILSSNIGTTISPQNQFTLKVPFTVGSPYTLVGAKFALIPTTTAQLVSFLNVFAVTGLSTLGNVTASNQGGFLELYSDLFGSSGDVLVSGGTANASVGAVISSGSTLVTDDIATITRTGSTVVLSTLDKHGLTSGQSVEVAGVNNSGFDGTFTLTSVTPHTMTYTQSVTAPTFASLTRSGNVVTAQTTAPNTLAVGDTITVAGVTDSSYDGTFTITSVSNNTTFLYAQAGANSSSSGGSITAVESSGGEIELAYTLLEINKANLAGFHVGQWVEISNTTAQSKVISTNSTTSMSITGFNTLNITSGPGSFQTARTTSADATTQINVEKNAQFVLMSWSGVGTAPNFTGGGVLEGDWVKIGGAFNAVNQGIFKVVKLYGANGFYIENTTELDQLVTMSANSDLQFYSYDSIMPGDQLMIQTSVLGALNQGTYTVSNLTFPSSTSIRLTQNFSSNIGSTPLGLSFSEISVQEAAPFYNYKRIVNISQDPVNPNGYDVVLFGDTLSNKITVPAGGSISAISKLNFPTTIQSGEDSYKYYGGLIHAVGQVERGEATDPVDFPGFAAAGSFIYVSAPLPLEVKISVVINNVTGVPFSTMQSRVQSAVASYVNSLGIGQPVVFSQIIAAVQAINGIQAVAISSPLYNATDYQIIVQFNQKPVIINVTSDITVSLAV